MCGGDIIRKNVSVSAEGFGVRAVRRQKIWRFPE
jgi:hypothetical protein